MHTWFDAQLDQKILGLYLVLVCSCVDSAAQESFEFQIRPAKENREIFLLWVKPTIPKDFVPTCENTNSVSL